MPAETLERFVGAEKAGEFLMLPRRRVLELARRGTVARSKGSKAMSKEHYKQLAIFLAALHISDIHYFASLAEQDLVDYVCDWVDEIGLPQEFLQEEGYSSVLFCRNYLRQLAGYDGFSQV